MKTQEMKIRLADLVEHPSQGQIFGTPDPNLVNQLAADIAENGQRTPIEIANNLATIICGHTRVAALRQLGKVTAKAIVLNFDADSPEALARLIGDNQLRRQMGALAHARAYEAIKEICDGHDEAWLRFRATSGYSKSQRTLARDRELLALPVSIQESVDTKLISRSTAKSILSLSRGAQEDIAGALLVGEDLSEVLAEYGLDKTRREETPESAAQRLFCQTLRHLESWRKDPDCFDRIVVRGSTRKHEILRELAEVATAAANRSEADLDRRVKEIRERMDR